MGTATAQVIAGLGFEPEIRALQSDVAAWVGASDPEVRPLLEWQFQGGSKYFRPLTVWSSYQAIYEGDIPLPPDTDPRVESQRKRRLVFLFVDEQGLGDYRLRYSTE